MSLIGVLAVTTGKQTWFWVVADVVSAYCSS
jgi:hypothetical protein